MSASRIAQRVGIVGIVGMFQPYLREMSDKLPHVRIEHAYDAYDPYTQAAY